MSRKVVTMVLERAIGALGALAGLLYTVLTHTLFGVLFVLILYAVGLLLREHVRLTRCERSTASAVTELGRTIELKRPDHERLKRCA